MIILSKYTSIHTYIYVCVSTKHCVKGSMGARRRWQRGEKKEWKVIIKGVKSEMTW